MSQLQQLQRVPFRYRGSLVSRLDQLKLAREDGQTLAEYALILALVAVLVVTAIVFLQGQISSLFSSIGSAI